MGTRTYIDRVLERGAEEATAQLAIPRMEKALARAGV